MSLIEFFLRSRNDSSRNPTDNDSSRLVSDENRKMIRNHGTATISSASFQQLYTARFIPLFLHIILLILIFVFRTDLVKNCGVNDYPSASTAYTWSDAWTGASLGVVVIEMILSLAGLSVFRQYPVFFSIVLHSAACALLSAYFMSDMSICTGSPYLLFFLAFLPLIIEIISWIELFAFKKKD